VDTFVQALPFVCAFLFGKLMINKYGSPFGQHCKAMTSQNYLLSSLCEGRLLDGYNYGRALMLIKLVVVPKKSYFIVSEGNLLM